MWTAAHAPNILTPMDMLLSDMLDRYSILLLKKERLPANKEVEAECARFEADIAARTNQAYISKHVALLKDVNGKIWDLESDIRKGKEGELGLGEVGRRALLIRDHNAERVRLKNVVAKELGEFEEIKVDHASET